MTDPAADEHGLRYICAVCGRTLDYRPIGGWGHTLGTIDAGEADHPAIPIRPSDAPEQDRPRCDFCFADDPRHVLEATNSFTLAVQSGSGAVEPAYNFSENWAACDGCAKLIDQGRWNDVLRRVKAGWQARRGPMDPAVEDGLRSLYRQLSKHSGVTRRLG